MKRTALLAVVLSLCPSAASAGTRTQDGPPARPGNHSGGTHARRGTGDGRAAKACARAAVHPSSHGHRVPRLQPRDRVDRWEAPHQDFVDKNGNPVRKLEAGKGFLLTYTNFGPDPGDPIAGQSIKIKTGGSVSSTRINPDGTETVTATGHNGLVLFPSDVPAGPSTTHYIGRIVYHVDPTTGVFTLLQESSNQRDVCAELSD